MGRAGKSKTPGTGTGGKRPAAWWTAILLALLCLPGGVAAAASGPGEPAETPHQILLALDPGAAGREESWRLVYQAARLLIALLPDEERLGLLTLEARPRMLLPPAPLSPAHRQRALRQLRQGAGVAGRSGPGPPLADSLEQARSWEGRGALVILTAKPHRNSGPHSETSPEAGGLHQDWRHWGWPVFALELGPPGDAGFLAQAAAVTGGGHFRADTPALLPPACLALVQQLKAPQMAPVTAEGAILDASVRRAVWFLPRTQASRPATLIDPRGQELRPGRGGSRVDWLAAPGFDLVSVRAPLAGTWRAQHADLARARCLLEAGVRLEVWIPEGELRADLCPRVGAALAQEGKILGDPALLAATGFSLEWAEPGGPAGRVRLHEAPPGCGSGLPAGWRFGLLPQPLPVGAREIRLRAENPGLRRERRLTLQVLPPVYSARPEGPERLRLAPAAEAGGGGRLSGWLGVRFRPGGLAGRLVKTAADGALTLDLSGLPPGELELAGELRGCDAQGLPLVLRPAPLRLVVAGAPVPAGSPPASRWSRLRQRLAKAVPSFPSLSLTPAKKRRVARFLGLGAGLGGVVLAAWLAWHLWRRRRRPAALPEQAADGPGLLAAEQLQAVLQDKARLEARLQEVEGEVRRLQAEKEKLQEESAARSRDLQEKSRRIAALKAEAEKAQEEARAVQEEYTALYVRSQKEKKALQQA